MRNYLLRILTVFLSVCALHTFSSSVWAGTQGSDGLDRVAEDGPVMYGYLIEDAERSIVSFDLSNGEQIQTHSDATIGTGYWGGGYYVEGTYYAQANGFSMTGSQPRLYSVPVKGGEIEIVTVSYLRAYAYDSATGAVYAYMPNELYVLNANGTGSTKVADIDHSIVALVADTEGNLYSVSEDAILYKLNKKTGAKQQIGELGISFNLSVGNQVMGAIFGESNDFFYLAAEVTGGNNGLYKVDISSGAATLVCQFPNNEYYAGLFFNNAVIEDAAPGKATNIGFVANTENPLVGQIGFSVATTTYSGATLGGTINAKIYLDGKLVDEKTGLTPGQRTVTKEIEWDSHEVVTVKIVLSNENGNGPSETASVSIGYDAPKPVTSLQIQLDEESGLPFLSWEITSSSPNIGANGGYVDWTKVVYQIIRENGKGEKETIEEAWSELSYSEMDQSLLEKEVDAYRYSVIPVLVGKTGSTQTTSYIVFGSPYTVPLEISFNSDNSSVYTNLFTIVDGNGDNSKWTILGSGGLQGPMPYSLPTTNDDWAYTPSIQLEAGVYSLKYTQSGNSPGWGTDLGRTVNYGITLGKEKAPQENDIIIAEREDVLYLGDATNYEEIITVEEAGVYYLGFHSFGAYTSETTAPRFDNIELNILAAEGAPAEITNLVLTPPSGGASGAVRVQFNMPMTDAGGNELEYGITGYKIYRDGVEVLDVTPDEGEFFEPGEAISKYHPADEGYYNYAVTAYNAVGEGLEVEATVFVGMDLPSGVKDLTLTKNDDGKAVITWNHTREALHGGYIEFNLLSFRITRSDGKVIEEQYIVSPEDWISELKPGSDGGIGSKVVIDYNASYVDNTIEEEPDVQNVYSYQVTPYYPNGAEGEPTTSNMLRFGNPFSIPFAESFAGADYENSGWSVELLAFDEAPNEYGWRIYDGDSDDPIATLEGTQDNDGGMAVFYGDIEMANTVQRLVSPLFTTEGMETPILEFWFYHNNKAGYNDRYLNVQVSVDGEEFVTLQKIEAVSTTTVGNELVSEWVKYRVDLMEYKDAETLLFAFEGNPNSASYVRSEVSLAIDNITLTNRLDYEFGITEFSLPQALVAGGFENKVSISVQNTGGMKTAGYTVDIYLGDNVLTTLNGTEIATLESAEFTYIWTPSLEEVGNSYEVYAVVKVESNIAEGNSTSETISVPVLSSVYPGVIELNGEAGEETITLNWNAVTAKTPVIVESISFPEGYVITSPELNGSAQTIRIAGLNYSDSENTFGIYVSSTDTETDSFVQIGEDVTFEAYEGSEEELVEFTYLLPEGTKYFEIRLGGQNTFFVRFREFFFAVNGAEDAQVAGYDIYRDGEKINTSLVSETTYIDAAPKNGDNSYEVVVVYEGDILSNYSEAEVVNITITGIDGIEKVVSVYSVSGSIVIEGAEELPINVVTIQGATIAIQTGTGNDVISVATGVYLVKVGDTVVKVNVK